MDERRFVTPAEAAADLRVSTDTVLRLIAAGELPAIRVSARIIRIPKPAFEIFRSGRTIPRRTVVTVPSEDEPSFGAGEKVPERQPA